MSSRPFKLVFLSGLALSVLFGNSPAMAQYTSSDDAVVVPTTGTSGTTTTRTSTPTGTSTTTSTSSSSQTVDTATRFSCQMDNGSYTVMYAPQSQSSQQYFAWATPQALGGGWDAQKRCATIAQRLETYRPDGLLELRTSTLNGYDVLCVTSEANPACRMVLTVPPGRDAYQVRNDVFQNLVSADSGQQTIGVNTYRGGGLEDAVNLGRTLLGNGNKVVSRDAIQLKPFLDKKDGGNGQLLGKVKKTAPQSRPSQSGNRLNPDRFR
ncbi:COP23 domain-containing protein [Rivularia sp. UHCC 0363]|uniref:COP23 domain-containing protein n=1 Tax=Rivularia sp. UHCC 0363 TaxID=3110244 RepID=UPI002B20CD9C|nr:COP23 domain-containing protein [Rivularia sp. UHCC 0363]MEA5594269.1 COP23 domain-containing protein [Rivularia sp. UHCC 0363]